MIPVLLTLLGLLVFAAVLVSGRTWLAQHRTAEAEATLQRRKQCLEQLAQLGFAHVASELGRPTRPSEVITRRVTEWDVYCGIPFDPPRDGQLQIDGTFVGTGIGLVSIGTFHDMDGSVDERRSWGYHRLPPRLLEHHEAPTHATA